MSVQVATGRPSSLPWGLITSDPELIARVTGSLADVEALLQQAAHSEHPLIRGRQPTWWRPAANASARCSP